MLSSRFTAIIYHLPKCTGKLVPVKKWQEEESSALEGPQGTAALLAESWMTCTATCRA